MAQAAEPDAWTETFLVSIQPKAGTAMDYRAVLTTYDISGGDKDFTSIANAKGGRVKNFTVQTDYEVTLEGYATEVGQTSSTGNGFFDLMHTASTSQPLSISQDHVRTQYMLAIEHTTDTSATSAVAESTDEERALRDVFKNGHFTMVNQSFTDGVCKFTLKFKSAPFDKSASSNVTFESTDGTTGKVLPAVTYT